MAHPIKQVLTERQRSLRWLAEQTGYSYMRVWLIVNGRAPVTLRFRRACVMALSVPDHELFREEVPA